MLATVFPKRPDLLAFWQNLQPGYEYFERFGTPPLVTVNAAGRYQIAPRTGAPVNATRPGVSGSGR